METNEDIARVLLNPETKQIVDIALYRKSLRFKCKRCAIFCCKLGGPKLTKEDARRIERLGYSQEEFINRVEGEADCSPPFLGSLKAKEDGSCIFLKSDNECSIHNHRPTLCKLYPFELFRKDSERVVLRLIPCCMGLDSSDGELVDERFIAKLFAGCPC